MAMRQGDEKTMSSGAVKNEHKHCDPKGQDIERQHAEGVRHRAKG